MNSLVKEDIVCRRFARISTGKLQPPDLVMLEESLNDDWGLKFNRDGSEFSASVVQTDLPGVMCTAADTVVTGILVVALQVARPAHDCHKFQLASATSTRHRESHVMMSFLHFNDRRAPVRGSISFNPLRNV